MKNKKIIDSWSKIKPDSTTDERVLSNILDRVHYGETKKGRFFDMKRTKKTYLKILAPLTACVLIALVVIVPMLLQNGNGGYYQQMSIDYVDVDFYVITESGEIESTTILTRGTVYDVFTKWAELNNVQSVAFIEAYVQRDGTTIDDGEVVTHILGDYIIFHLTLSHEFAAYMDGANGQLLFEALTNTFYSYGRFDEFNLILQ